VVDELNVGLVQAGSRAVAYYRCSVADEDRRALLMQQDRVRRWAIANEVQIIREFCDVSPDGADSEVRPAFAEMVNDWIARRNDFDRVLCFESSRLGRVGGEGHNSFKAVCRQHGKRVVAADAV